MKYIFKKGFLSGKPPSLKLATHPHRTFLIFYPLEREGFHDKGEFSSCIRGGGKFTTLFRCRWRMLNMSGASCGWCPPCFPRVWDFYSPWSTRSFVFSKHSPRCYIHKDSAIGWYRQVTWFLFAVFSPIFSLGILSSCFILRLLNKANCHVFSLFVYNY